ncbi:MAG: N-acetylmuramoyl-L-alanine amidase [archaeon]|nr:N-acetylmuramoyl-L-alanine amidase [archaeon]
MAPPGEQAKNNDIGGLILMTSEDIAKASNDATVPKNLYLVSTDAEAIAINHLKLSYPLKNAGEKYENASEVTAMAQVLALQLKQNRINMDLAPVLDVSKSGALAPRVFSNNSSVVSLFGTAFITALQSNGIIATAKHFPGYGENNDNTDDGEVNDARTLDYFKQKGNNDIAPFIDAKESGVEAIMVNSINYAGTGKAVFNASLYPQQLIGFSGLVVTDDLSPIVRNNKDGSCEEVAVKAVNAGADVLLFVDPQHVDCSIKGLLAAVNSGKLDKQKILASAQKIKALSKKYPIGGGTVSLAEAPSCKPIITKIQFENPDHSFTTLGGDNILEKWDERLEIPYNQDATVASSFKANGTKDACKIYQWTFELWTEEPTTADKCSENANCLRVQLSSGKDATTALNVATEVINTKKVELNDSYQDISVKGESFKTLGEAFKAKGMLQNPGDVQNVYLRVETCDQVSGAECTGNWKDSHAYKFILKIPDSTQPKNKITKDDWFIWLKKTVIKPPATDGCKTIAECKAILDLKMIEQVFQPYEVITAKKYFVLIDPGHGGIDSGAVVAGTDLKESDFTWQIATSLKHKLEAKGFDTLLTRTQDETLPIQSGNDQRSPKVISLLEQKKEVYGADNIMFVSVHLNSIAGNCPDYSLSLYNQGKNSAFADALRSGLEESGFSEFANIGLSTDVDVTPKHNTLAMVREPQVVTDNVALVEYVFLCQLKSYSGEQKKEFVENAATATLAGIEKFVGSSSGGASTSGEWHDNIFMTYYYTGSYGAGGTTALNQKPCSSDPNDSYKCVALPNKTALEKTIQICSAAEKCGTYTVNDVGPWCITDPYVLTPEQRPIAEAYKKIVMPNISACGTTTYVGKKTNGAGIDVSPNVLKDLGLPIDNATVKWRFVDASASS